MTNNFQKFFRKLRTNRAGTASIEAAIMVPLVLAPVFIGTVDLGMTINSGQNLSSTTRSASQYLLNGGRSVSDLKSVIVDSFEGTLDPAGIAVSTSCACPNADAISGGGEQSTPLPYSFRTVTLTTLDQCSITCSDGSDERVLVNISIDYLNDGIYRDVTLNKTISVRIE